MCAVGDLAHVSVWGWAIFKSDLSRFGSRLKGLCATVRQASSRPMRFLCAGLEMALGTKVDMSRWAVLDQI